MVKHQHYLRETQSTPDPHPREPSFGSMPPYPVDRPDSAQIPRRWHQWYARSLEVEATPLEIAEPQRRRWGRYIYLALAILGFGLLLNFLAGKVFLYTATGTVGARQYPLSPASTMTVANIDARPGEAVKAGAVVMQFSSPALAQELARTKARIAETESRLRDHATATSGTAASLAAEISGLQGQEEALEQQYSDHEQQLQSLRSLAASGAISHADLAQTRQDMLTIKAQYDGIDAKLEADRARLKDLKRLNLGKHDTASLLGSLKQLRKSLRSRMNALQLRSPIDGVVAQVPVSEGQVVKAGQPAAVVVPGDDERTLLYFPPAARSRLQVGKTLSVQTPDGNSVAMRIRQIFPSVQDVPDELQTDMDRKAQAVVVLAAPVDAAGSAEPIQPGTPVTASVDRWDGGEWLHKAWSAVRRVTGRALG